MEFIKGIKELEEILNIKFERISFSKIRWNLEKSAKYSVNRNQQINGININKLSLKKIPEVISEMKSLTHLVLSNCDITNIKSITNLSNIIHLNLSSNKISDISLLDYLKKVKYLNLRNNQIKKIDSLKFLAKLQYLDLKNNEISKTLALADLKRLNHIDLGSNYIVDIQSIFHLFIKDQTFINIDSNPLSEESIGLIKSTKPTVISTLEQNLHTPFKKVEELDTKKLIFEKKAEYTINRNCQITGIGIYNHDIESIPQEIVSLNELKILVLQRNKIKDISLVSKLKLIEHIDIEGNLISDISPLQNLKYLKVADLANNEIQDISPLQELKQIEELYLRNNRINDLSSLLEIPYFQKTNAIYLQGNQIDNISIISRFRQLTYLDLSNNNLEDITPLRELAKLRKLRLENNNIKNLIPLKKLKNLELLALNYNSIENLPKWITKFKMKIKCDDNSFNTGFLSLSQNPIITPPIEIVKQSNEAIKNYFEQLDIESKQYLFETKLLIIGEGGTGKTSFAVKMKDENAKLPDDIDTTIGIDISKWSFEVNHPIRGKQIMYANLWDFGGQRIYQGTHQIFFSQKSFYVLLDDTREEKTDYAYWVNTVEQLAGNQSRLQVVINKKHKHNPQIDQNGLLGRFGNLINGFFEVDLKNNKSMVIELQNEIKHSLIKLEGIGDPLPSSWVNIRKDLFKIEADSINYDQYIDICKKNGTDLTKINFLSDYFNRIGVLTHFYDDKLLKQRVYLNSNWLVNRVYDILNHEIVKEKKGKISETDLVKIWKSDDLINEIDHLSHLMNRFGLMYEISDKKEYVIPTHLPTQQPYRFWQYEEERDVLKFAYKFEEYAPRGIITKVIVALNSYIINHNLVWKKGVNIKLNNSFAEIKETYGTKVKYQIRIIGSQKKELLGIIIHEFDKLLDAFEKIHYEKLVPCTCLECKTKSNPYFFEYSSLMNRKEKGKKTIECDNSYKEIDVIELLDGLIVSENEKSLNKQYLKELIIEGKIDLVCNQLMKATEKNAQDLHKKIINLAAQDKSNKSDRNLNLVDNEEYKRERNRISNALLDCIDQL